MSAFKAFMRFVFVAAGGAVGGLLGQPALGAAVGGALGAILFPYDRPDGPRLEELQIQTSGVGQPINIIYGAMRVAGNMIWLAPVDEIVREEDGVKSRYYYATFAIGLGEGEVSSILRTWADNHLVQDTRSAGPSDVIKIEDFDMRLYTGTETQEPDSWIEYHEGDGEVPAFRGLAYVVFHNFPLEKFSNRIPNFTFEVATETTLSVPYQAVYGIESTIWGSDSIVWNPDEIMVTVHAAGYWNKINTVTGYVVTERNHLLDGGGAEIADYGDFDIDETGTIYTTKYNATPNASNICTLDGDTFAEIDVSSETIWPPSRVRVSKDEDYPYIAIVTTGGGHLYIARRDTLEVIADITPPSGKQEFYSVWIDSDNERIWAVMKDWLGVATDTYIARITVNLSGNYAINTWSKTSDIEKGDEIFYDRDNERVVVGSTANQDVAFFNASSLFIITLPNVGTITSEGCSAWAKSTWQQGPTEGFLYYAYTVDELKRINLQTMEIDRTWTSSPHPGNWNGGSVYDPRTHSIITGCQGGTFAMAKIKLDRMGPSAVDLSDIVADICERRGLVDTVDFDVSSLTGTVWGYVLNNNMTARAALQPLMDAYFFDGYESDGLLKFEPRGGAIVESIPEDDLAAHDYGGDRPQKLLTTRVDELELPRRVEIMHADPDKKYEVGMQAAERQVTNSTLTASIEVPIAMDKDDAKQVAVKRLASIWAGRNGYKCFIPRDYIQLEPSNPITVTEGGVARTMRINAMGMSKGLLEIDGVGEDADAYTADDVGIGGPDDPEYVSWPGPTYLTPIDAPLFDESKNRFGTWFAALAYTAYWNGCDVLRSSRFEDYYQSPFEPDGYDRFGIITVDAIIARTMNAVGDVNDAQVWDEGNTINIRLLDQDDFLSLSTESEIDVLNGANAGLLVKADGSVEGVAWRTVTEESDKSITLSGLLRGRYGTDDQTSGHAALEDLVIIDTAKMKFLNMVYADLNREYQYTAQSIEELTGLDRLRRWKDLPPPQDFTWTARNLMPLSPQHIAGTRAVNGDLTITWVRRTRIGGDDWMDGQAIPLGEIDERYEIDVYDGSTLKRTISATSETATYTAAQQTTDFGSAQASVVIEIYQLATIESYLGDEDLRGVAGAATV